MTNVIHELIDVIHEMIDVIHEMIDVIPDLIDVIPDMIDVIPDMIGDLYKPVKYFYTHQEYTKDTNNYKTISYIVWYNTDILLYKQHRILTIK